MTPTFESLGLHQLPVDQRIALAQEILDSVVAEQSPGPLSDVKRQELKRRLEAYAANPNDVIP